MRWLWVVAVLALMVFLLFRGEEPVVDDGVERRERIVSLAPNLTQVVQMLGRGADLVGVTRLCPDVPESVARVGDHQVDFERVIALEPDRVLAIDARIQEQGMELLRRHGITVEVHPAYSVDDVRRLVASLGASLDAEAAAADYIARLDEVLAAPVVSDPPTILFVVDRSPIYVAGGGSFIDEMITAAGGRNVYHDAEWSYREGDMEDIVRRDPELIIDVSLSPEGGGATPEFWQRWEHLRAVRAGAVEPFPPVQPGPGIVAWVERLRAIVRTRRP